MPKRTQRVPWISRSEWLMTYKNLFKDDVRNQQFALDQMRTWQARPEPLHVGVRATIYLLESKLATLDTATKKYHLAMLKLAVVRFVTDITYIKKNKESFVMNRITETLKLPNYLLLQRNSIVHDVHIHMSYASIVDLVEKCFQWIKVNYWDSKYHELFDCQESMTQLPDTFDYYFELFANTTINAKFCTIDNSKLKYMTAFYLKRNAVEFIEEIVDEIFYKIQDDDCAYQVQGSRKECKCDPSSPPASVKVTCITYEICINNALHHLIRSLSNKDKRGWYHIQNIMRSILTPRKDPCRHMHIFDRFELLFAINWHKVLLLLFTIQLDKQDKFLIDIINVFPCLNINQKKRLKHFLHDRWTAMKNYKESEESKFRLLKSLTDEASIMKELMDCVTPDNKDTTCSDSHLPLGLLEGQDYDNDFHTSLLLPPREEVGEGDGKKGEEVVTMERLEIEELIEVGIGNTVKGEINVESGSEKMMNEMVDVQGKTWKEEPGNKRMKIEVVSEEEAINEWRRIMGEEISDDKR